MKTFTRLPFFRRLARVAGARLFHWAENNGCSAIERNGEAWLLESLFGAWAASPSAGPRVVIDGGANVGEFTARVLAAADQSRVAVAVVAFEPSAVAHARLRERFGGDARVRLVGAALGAEAGRAVLSAAEAGSSQGSLVRRSSGAADVRESVEVVALGPWLETAGTARVDLLKLDVEGAELAALRGLGPRLAPGHVGAIQFEYGGTTLAARATLRDFHELLDARGYVVAKLLPAGLLVRPYAEWMDHFAYANFVALPRDTPA